MKSIIKSIFLLALFAGFFSACKKDENQVTFQGGTNPVLSASRFVNPMVLLPNNQAAEIIKFDWTNPNYQFNTGLSSQDVSYSIQFDTVGSNFTNPRMVEVSVSKELTKTFKSGELNDILVGVTKLKLLKDVPHDIEVRVKSNLFNGSVPLYSNSLIFTITPHFDPNIPRLWITGSGTPSGWTNSPPFTQEFNYIGDRKFEIEMDFTPGNQYKFLTKLGSWQPQWGGCGPLGGTISENPGGQQDPDAINTPSDPGRYKVSVDLDTKTCTVVRM
jgi:hypothetical protein